MLEAKASASSFSKFPVIITSVEKPCETVAADKHILPSFPHVSLSFLYEFTPFSKLYHITIMLFPLLFSLTLVVASKNFSLFLTFNEIAGFPESSYDNFAPLSTLESISKLSSTSLNDIFATFDKTFLAPSISVTPASFTLILSLPSMVISGSDTPKESTFLFKISYVLDISLLVNFLPSLLFTWYKTSKPPLRSSPNFKSLNKGM